MYWAENIQGEFFNGEGLRHMIPYIVDNENRGIEQILSGTRMYVAPTPKSDKQMDPISNAVSLCLTRPLALVLNEIGAMPFQDRPHIVFPYSKMTDTQRAFVHACIQHRNEWRICNETLTFNRGKIPVHINPETVLTTTCELIMTAPSSHDTATKIALCNIILQRVQSHFPLDAHKQEIINACMRKFKSQEASNEVKDS